MSSTLIRGARVFDGSGAAPYPADILIDGGVLSAVGATIPAGEATIVDAEGCFVTPGFIDCHVHATLLGDEALLTYARAGVTTVKDLGGAFEATLDLRRRQREGGVPGARVLVVGSFVEGDPPSWGGMIPDTMSGMDHHRTAADIERTVRRNLDAGVNAIKLYAGLPPHLLRHAIEQVAGAVPVSGHITATTATEAVGAGIGGLEHLQLSVYRDLAPAEHQLAEGMIMADPAYWMGVRRGWEAIDPASVQPLADAMAAAGTVIVPTLVPGGRTNQEFSAEEEAAFTAGQRERLALRPAFMADSASLERSARNMRRVVEVMHAAGVSVLPGTDCGAVGVPPGFGYHIELGLLADVMPARDVLTAATSGAARWLRRDDIGVIAPGKRADCVLLEADPLADIANARRIRAVYMDGVAV